MSNWYKDGALVSVKLYGQRVSVGDKVELTLSNDKAIGTIDSFNIYDVLVTNDGHTRRIYSTQILDVKILEKNMKSVLTA